MSPQEIFKKMYDQDEFSQWLGIELLEMGLGSCQLKMQIRDEMCNGFGVAHGGISFSFADSAFAFASNSRGKKAVSVETSISHTRPIFPGDLLLATAKEMNVSKSLGIYEVQVTNQDGKTVALFKGTVFRKEEEWS
jgi:acyl-CoA thioesterase